MKRKELKKAIKSATPFESLYALLPEKQKEKFKQFAAGRKRIVFVKKGLTFLIYG